MVESRPKIQVLGYYFLSGDLRPLTVNASGELNVNVTSGDIAASVSGQPIWVTSGEINASQAGAWGVQVSGAVIVSGDIAASVSGQPIYVTSGDINIIPASEIKTGSIRILSANSGGEVLHSGSIKSLTVKALSTNSGDIYIGGVTNRPYSGYGFCLAAGEGKSYDISDFNKVYLMAVISGDKITFDGII